VGIAGVLQKCRSFPLTVTTDKALEQEAASENMKTPDMKGSVHLPTVACILQEKYNITVNVPIICVLTLVWLKL
jgi:hypothetical protein